MAEARALDLLAALTDHVGVWWSSATQLQRSDAAAILEPGPDGPRRHWIGRAKGYSKTRDVAAMSLVALMGDDETGFHQQMPPGSTGYVAASDLEQTTLVRQSIASFVAHTPALTGAVTIESRRVTATGPRTELVLLPADTAGSHGLRPGWLCVDELANWPDTERHQDFFDAIWAGLPKVKASRGIIITTAGSPSHFSRKILDAALDDPLWRVSTVEGPPPWTDPAEVESERKRLMPSRFARLWNNVWSAPDDSLADPDDVAAACVLDGPLAPDEGVRYLATLDVGTRHDRCVVSIGHAVRDTEGTRVVCDRLQVWTPRPGAPVQLDDVRAYLVEMCRAYRASVLYDPSQAYLMAEQIRKSGVGAREFVFSSASVGHLATAMMQALRGRLLTLPDDEELRNELMSVRLRETSPNVLRIDHKAGRHDDRVIAVAMLVYELTKAGGGIGPLIHSDEEWAAIQIAERRSMGEPIPEPAPLNAWYSGDTSMSAALDLGDEDEDPGEKPNGKTARSPFL